MLAAIDRAVRTADPLWTKFFIASLVEFVVSTSRPTAPRSRTSLIWSRVVPRAGTREANGCCSLLSRTRVRKSENSGRSRLRRSRFRLPVAAVPAARAFIGREHRPCEARSNPAPKRRPCGEEDRRAKDEPPPPARRRRLSLSFAGGGVPPPLARKRREQRARDQLDDDHFQSIRGSPLTGKDRSRSTPQHTWPAVQICAKQLTEDK